MPIRYRTSNVPPLTQIMLNVGYWIKLDRSQFEIVKEGIFADESVRARGAVVGRMRWVGCMEGS